MRFRGLLALSGLIAASAIGLFILSRNVNRDCRDLGPLDQFAPLKVYAAPCAKVYITAANPQPLVLLAYVPHLPGEPAAWSEEGHVFEGLHGEEYDAVGNKVSGPGLREMWRCPTLIQDARLRLATTDAEPDTLRVECDMRPNGKPHPESAARR